MQPAMKPARKEAPEATRKVDSQGGNYTGAKVEQKVNNRIKSSIDKETTMYSRKLPVNELEKDVKENVFDDERTEEEVAQKGK